nr:flagellar hook-length control protein FliK [Vibrio diabolicus]
MIVLPLTQAFGNALSSNENTVKQPKTIHGLSQNQMLDRDQSGGQAILLPSTLPSFRHTTASLASAEKAHTTGFNSNEKSVLESNATLETKEIPELSVHAQTLTLSASTMAESLTGQNVETSAAAVVSELKTTTQDTPKVLLGFQSRKQGMQPTLPFTTGSRSLISNADLQATFSQTVQGQTITTSPHTSIPNTKLQALLDKSTQGKLASTSPSLSISSTDFQTLLSQPAQGQPTASPLQGQTPTPQAPNTAISASHIQTQGSEWAAVRVDTSAGKWGEQMMQVLHDRVTLQAQQNVQEAKIRLDPPDLGKLDLLVRVEGDRLSVHINANTAATREALMQVSERLRTELQEQSFVHVDVNVGSDQSQSRNDQQTNEEDATIFAERESGVFATDTTNYSEHWLSTQA